MTETTGEIQAHIRETREDLSANLNELEQKVQSATDWRQHFEKSPLLFLAVALGGGLLLAHATNGRRARPISALPASPAPAPLHVAPSPVKEGGQVRESIGVIKSALIGMAANQAKNVLSKLLPGFEAQLADAEKPRQNPKDDPMRRPTSGNGSSASIPRD
ncbi:MAG: hypothetical protein WDM77_07700 [Steroidobacteraceae bacterium]